MAAKKFSDTKNVGKNLNFSNLGSKISYDKRVTLCIVSKLNGGKKYEKPTQSLKGLVGVPGFFFF